MRNAAVILLLSLASIGANAQMSVQAAPEEKNTIVSSYRGSYSKQVFVDSTSQVFPHLATGGGWETVIVIVNMSNVSVPFSMNFFGEDGLPLAVSFRDYPGSNVVTSSGATGNLPGNASFNFALFDSTPSTRIGWASLSYDSTIGRIGGYAIFRQRVAGRADYEALVPLSSYTDYRFYMPFDNIQGFLTGMAIVNPSSNVTAHVTLTALDLGGVIIDRVVLTLPPGNHTSFLLNDRFPQFANRLGTLYVESDTNRLSGLGIRVNAAGGFAFSSVPILNWENM